MSVHVEYTTEAGRVVLELQGDPIEICNAVRDRMFPDQKLPATDPAFDAIFKQSGKGPQ